MFQVFLALAGKMDAMLMPVPELPPPETTTRDWSELPVDVLSVVFAELGTAEILMGAGIVSSSWLHAAMLPHLWRCVDMAQGVHHDAVCCAMAKVAVDRSGGRLEVFKATDFVDDELLKYIGHRSPGLKSLCLDSCSMVSNTGLTQLMAMTPLLEDLVLRSGLDLSDEFDDPLVIPTMHQLRQIALGGLYISRKALTKFVDSCPHLELLDASECIAVDVVDDDALRAKCAGIKTLKLPSYSAATDAMATVARLYYYLASEDDDDDDAFYF
ncbi:putative F-box/LRR-repeat protein 23 [Oryza glaberrima]|nr:putative F-box/LRR-repeat protein 23 [Oryza glaberrima]